MTESQSENDAQRDAVATQYSKNAIFIWCVSGVIYFVVAEQKFSLWILALLFMPGIFIASFAAIPVLLLDLWAKRIAAQVSPYPAIRAFLVLATATVVRISLFAVQVALPIIFVLLCARVI